MGLSRRAAAASLLLLLAGPLFAEEVPADELGARLEGLFSAMARAAGELTDYSCTFTKQEYVGGKLLPTETILLKQSRPIGCVYMKWIAEPEKNRETIYCPARNGGKLQVHEGGGVASWLGTLSLDPLGTLAMKGQRHPITEAGIFYTIDTIRRSFARERQSARRGDVGDANVEGQPSLCAAIAPGESPDQQGYASMRTEICSHRTLHLPTRVRLWEPDGQLVEHYTYRDYRLNPGLTERDFDTANHDYGF